MQEVVANLDHVKFDLEYAIEQQLGVQPLPFTGMDSEYLTSSCYILFIINMYYHNYNYKQETFSLFKKGIINVFCC